MTVDAHRGKSVQRKPFRTIRHASDAEYGISTQLHIIDKPQVKSFGSFGSKRLVKLQREALDFDCVVERRQKGYNFTSCDTGAAGIHCSTLDDVDEELDNFRL